MIRCVLQFLLEQGLDASYRALAEESGVTLNLARDPARLRAQIEAGAWDAALREIAAWRLPPALLRRLRRHLVIELAEAHEPVLAGRLAEPLEADSGAADLRRLIAAAVAADGDGAAPPATLVPDLAARRARLADALLARAHVTRPGGGLLSWLERGLRWQRARGRLTGDRNATYDVFHEVMVAAASDDGDAVMAAAADVAAAGPHDGGPAPVTITVEPPAIVTVRWVPGAPGTLVAAHVTGALSFRCAASGELDGRRPPQDRGRLLAHDAAVTVIAFAGGGTEPAAVLASGDARGTLKLWDLRTGDCCRTWVARHAAPVTAIALDPAGRRLASLGADGSVDLDDDDRGSGGGGGGGGDDDDDNDESAGGRGTRAATTAMTHRRWLMVAAAAATAIGTTATSVRPIAAAFWRRRLLTLADDGTLALWPRRGRGGGRATGCAQLPADAGLGQPLVTLLVLRPCRRPGADAAGADDDDDDDDAAARVGGEPTGNDDTHHDGSSSEYLVVGPTGIARVNPGSLRGRTGSLSPPQPEATAVATGGRPIVIAQWSHARAVAAAPSQPRQTFIYLLMDSGEVAVLDRRRCPGRLAQLRPAGQPLPTHLDAAPGGALLLLLASADRLEVWGGHAPVPADQTEL